MKSIVSISMILCLMFQTFSKPTLLATYLLNKPLIVEYFCVNKEKPALHCEGSCFMKEQLSKEEPEKKPASESVRDYETQLIFIGFDLLFANHASGIPFFWPNEQGGQEQTFPFSLFHPPQLA